MSVVSFEVRDGKATYEGRDSDIDLLVVLSELQVRHHDAAVAISRVLRELPVPVDVVVTDEAELLARVATPGMVRIACREGVLVYG